nr:hypothetical protein [Tanacetum cinerariifolium]
EAQQDSGNINRTQSMTTLNEPLPQRTSSGSGPTCQLTILGVKDQHSQLSPITHPQCTTLSNKVESLEIELKITKQTYGVAFTKLIKKVKKLKKTIKTGQAKRRAKIVISDDDMVSEDSSKQRRMIEDIDQDTEVILVTPTKVSSQEDQPDDQLGVLSAAKILADITRVHTYSRRRRAVSTGSGAVSTASRIISTAEETVSTAGVSMTVSTTGMVQEKRQERDEYKAAIRLQEQQDKEENQRIAMDAEIAQRLHEEIDATERRRMTQQLIIIAPEQGMNVEELQVKYPIIDWEIYTEDSRKYRKIIIIGNHTEVYQFFDDMLKVFNMDDLVQLWSLVKERFSSTEPNDDKDRVLWVELKRLFKPDVDDELWKLQRYMHDLLKWRLYDTCGVHHVSTERGHDIFMLVEKDYPLTKRLMTVMLVNKLQVYEFSKMAN